jgi:SAM-dependent methyltransferase
LLFASDTYYALIVKIITGFVLNHKSGDLFSVEQIENNDYYSKLNIDGYLDRDYFDWYRFEDFNNNDLADLFRILKIFTDDIVSSNHDMLKILHQSIVTRQSRYRTGEYYTPDWLVDYTVESSGYTGSLQETVLDPSCGSGSFLFFAARKILASNKDEEIDPQLILKLLHGYDINPLAVLTAKANLLIALRRYIPFKNKIKFNIQKYDLLDDIPFSSPELFDYIFGNPPWLNWKSLSEIYKKKIIPIAERYGLFNQKGLKARLGFAEDDISSILTYISIDRYLKDDGKLAFILPQSLFQSIGGGEGFRKLYLSNKNIDIFIERVVDFVKVSPFKTASNRAALFIAKKGKTNIYPVCYDIISKLDDEKSIFDNLEEFYKKTKLEKCFAEPIDKSNVCSPWIVTPDSNVLQLLRDLMSESYYKARAGACTWMSGVYWIDILKYENGFLRISNNPGYGKIKIKQLNRLVEPDLIYPLIRGRDIEKWHAEPKGNILFPQDSQNPAKAMTEEKMQKEYKLTYDYLNEFKELLLERKGYKKFLSRQSFYAIYDVGPYTISPYKVGWKYLSKNLNAAVIYNNDQKIIIPDLNVITISADSLEEAYYLSALLNSSIIQIIIRTYGECLRITPGIMKQLPIPRYNEDDHKSLVELGKQSHDNFKDKDQVKENEREIDEVYAYILGLNKDNLKMIKDYLHESK